MFLSAQLIFYSFIFTIPTITSIRIVKRETAALRHSDLRPNCSPQSGECNLKQEDGIQTFKNCDSDEQCAIGVAEQTVYNKKQLNKEIKDRYGAFKENCFPLPSGGCRCVEKDSDGNEAVKKYNDETQCKISMRRRASKEMPSQNVRDPVRERAQANYRAVINELNEKFKGLKEGCFPRPRGCLCVIGKDPDGRDITERRMKDRDCKCQPGERGHGCPISGA